MKKMKGVFCFKVKGAGGNQGVWVVDAKNGSGSVKFGVERAYLSFIKIEISTC